MIAYVFGEIHNNTASVKNINNEIRKIKPDFILHELLYDDKCLTQIEVSNRLNNCSIGGKCDPRINKDIYQLGYDLKAKLIGIDLDIAYPKRLKIGEQFRRRESHMLRLIEQYCLEDSDLKIVIVVGDTHLRSKVSKDLGSSSVLSRFFSNNKNFIVNRAPLEIQELP